MSKILGGILKICIIFLIIFGWVFSGWPQISESPQIPPKINLTYASDTGFLSAGSVANTSWDTWTVSSLALDDDSESVHNNIPSAEGALYDFNFNIPSDAESINGIEVQIITWENHYLCHAYLETSLSWNDGSNYTSVSRTPDSGDMAESETTYTEGGSTNTWGRSWTVDEINNSFRVKIVGYNSKSGKHTYIDQVLIKVYYTPATSTVAITLNTDGAVSFGYLALDTTVDTSADDINDIEVISVDSGPADLDVKSTVFTEDGNIWTLSTSNGDNQALWEFSPDDSSWSDFAVEDTLYSLATNVAESSTQNLYLRLTTPTSTNSYSQYSSTVTIVASAP